MVTIEKITNGYIVKFRNTNNIRLKMYFPTIDAYASWLKDQFEPKKETL